MSDEDWMPIGAIAASLVNGVAPAGEEHPARAGAQGVKRLGRAHHDGEPRGGAGADVIWVNFRRSGAAQPEGPTWPPRHSTIDTVSDGRVGPSIITPATGGLGNARRAKL